MSVTLTTMESATRSSVASGSGVTERGRSESTTARGFASDASPNIEWEGQSSCERFGGAASVIGDLDGDGAMIFSLDEEDSLGPDVGRPFLVWGDEDMRLSPLIIQRSGGDGFGASVGIVGSRR